jgi:predicted porin
MINVTKRRAMRLRGISAAMIAALALVGRAHAADDQSLTWNGITLYGVYDIGVGYQSHGAPLSQDWFVGVQYLIDKKSNKPNTSLAPDGLSQSRLGLRGNEKITDDISFVFNAEMGFDPQSGNLADAPGALKHNNGVPVTSQTSAGDSSRAGQFFNGPAFGGFSSKEFGTLTFGRHNTLLLDNILKYDPMGGSYAFSIIGLSGVTAGMGDTEDARLDGSAKYFYKNDVWHAGALYQFGKTDSSPGEAWQGNVGFSYAGFDIDGIYGHKKDAISAASLSAAQITAGAPRDSLAATISDNTSYTLAASYIAGPWKGFLGYEHIKYENPDLPLTIPFSGLDGYYLSILNNSAFPNPKVLQVSWAGVRYLVNKDFDVTAAAYHYDQNSYGLTRCSDNSAGTCSGSENVYSMMADYRWTSRFDTYGGVMWSGVYDGLANGSLHRSTLSPTVGFRFKF